MEYTTGDVADRLCIPQQTLQTWLKRFPHLIEMSGGGKAGRHRRFPLATMVQLIVAKMVRDGSTFSVERALKIGKNFADYRDDVRIHDEVLLVVTKTDVLIHRRGHS